MIQSSQQSIECVPLMLTELVPLMLTQLNLPPKAATDIPQRKAEAIQTRQLNFCLVPCKPQIRFTNRQKWWVTDSRPQCTSSSKIIWTSISVHGTGSWLCCDWTTWGLWSQPFWEPYDPFVRCFWTGCDCWYTCWRSLFSKKISSSRPGKPG